MRSATIDLEDQIVQIFIDTYDPASQGAITTYTDDSCDGHASRYMVLEKGTDPSQRADFPQGSLDPDYGTDEINSVMIP